MDFLNLLLSNPQSPRRTKTPCRLEATGQFPGAERTLLASVADPRAPFAPRSARLPILSAAPVYSFIARVDRPVFIDYVRRAPSGCTCPSPPARRPPGPC